MSAESNGPAEEERTGDHPERVHLTQWFRRRPTSLEFWDAVVTDEELVWCFLGESFSSLLLRADVSQYGREEVTKSADDELTGLNGRNVSIPLSALRAIELDEGSRLRRSKLTVTWATAADGDGKEAGDAVSWKLYGTADADSEADLVESLATDDRFVHADVRVRRRSGWF